MKEAEYKTEKAKYEALKILYSDSAIEWKKHELEFRAQQARQEQEHAARLLHLHIQLEQTRRLGTPLPLQPTIGLPTPDPLPSVPLLPPLPPPPLPPLPPTASGLPLGLHQHHFVDAAESHIQVGVDEPMVDEQSYDIHGYGDHEYVE